MRTSLSISAILGGLVAGLGLLVLIGWYSSNINLVLVHPSFVAMQYNTALGFLLSGIAIMVLHRRRGLVSALLAVCVLLLGSLTLAEYLWNLNLGIDTLFDSYFIDADFRAMYAQGSLAHPHRMAPNTAFCFSLVGLSIWLASRPHGEGYAASISSLGCVVFALGVVSFTGYLAGAESLFGWGGLAVMAIHTSAGFMVLGGGLFTYGLRLYHQGKEHQGVPVWLVWPIAILGLSITSTLWMGLNAYRDSLGNHIDDYSSYAAESMLLFGFSSTVALIMALRSRLSEDAEPLAARSLYKAPLVVVVLGAILSLSIFQVLESSFDAGVKQNFEAAVQRRGNAISQNFSLYFEPLYHLRGLFYASERVTEEKFSLMAQETFDRHAGIVSVHWLPYVQHSERAIFEESIVKEIGRDFSIRQFSGSNLVAADVLEDYFPITYMESASVYRSLEGLNVASVPYHEAAIDFAVSHNRLSIVDLVSLITSGDSDRNIYVYLPVYSDRAGNSTPGYQKLRGVITLAFQMKPTIEDLLERYFLPAGLDMQFESTSSDAIGHTLYYHSSRVSTEDVGVRLEGSYNVKVANKTWKMTAYSSHDQLYPKGSFFNYIPPVTIFIIAIALAEILRKNSVRNREKAKFLSEIETREQHYSVLVDTIPGTAYTCLPDAHQTMLFMSDEIEEIAGYCAQSFTETNDISWLDVIHDDDRERLVHEVSNINLDNQEYTTQYRIWHKEGRLRWVLERGKAVFDQLDRIKELHGTMIDITESKLNEAKFQGLLESTPDSVVITNEDGTIAFINNQAETVFGYSNEEVVGQKVELLIPENFRENHPRLRQDYTLYPKQRSMGTGVELAALTRSGKEIPVEISLSPMQTDGGVLVTAAIRDITDRKNLENELIQAKEKAEQATRAKGDFLANMSHEIRTPMNAIIGMSNLALETDLNPRQLNYIEKVNRSAESLLGIINDMLDFSKIDAGKLQIENVSFCLEDVFSNLANVVGLKAEEKGLELLFDLDPDVPLNLVGDPLRLGQVLLNLGSNAVKFTSSGEVVISVEKIEGNGEAVVLEFHVRDSGIGIEEEKRETLFESFSQADTSTTRQFGGTGLGLTISKKLAELMGGSIRCESVVGQGSIFSFSAEFERCKESPQSFSDVELDSMRVLVVDDNGSSRQILDKMLSSFGLRTYVVSSGIDALKIISDQDQTDPFDLAVVDWKMPNLDGVDTIRKIQLNTELKSQPKVLMATAFCRDELNRVSEDIDVGAVLEKPVTPSSLLDGVYRALGRSLRPSSRSASRMSDIDALIRKLQGARVLVVEDNDINMELAVDILTQSGMLVTKAVNGQEAIEALNYAEFDGVLMDCQMPVMDGYEATRAIRQNVKYKELPILAMTANAMVGDREKVLAAGMNDHIPKPIQKYELFNSMARWISPQGEAFVERRAEKERRASALGKKLTNELPYLDGVDVVQGLQRCGGNSELYLRLLMKFSNRERSFSERSRQALEDQDFVGLGDYAHSLKGVAGNLAIVDVERNAERLQTACRERDNDGSIEVILIDLERDVNKVLTSLSTLSSADSYRGSDQQSENVAALLDELRQYLEEFDTQAVTCVETLKSSVNFNVGESILAQLIKAIDRFDFELALKQLASYEKLYSESHES
ncbi:MAG: hypothetical protein CL693_17210 [Cellvibrionaceae bacterium]|nr:hypothetical protein [Cellvibrionaceae bacterium]|tara:strand:- start:24034 stop:28947 length:4914 start_codon:yes stop_codon:yes gene_type:complete